MRIIFMGTPEFSAEFLKHLIAAQCSSENVLAVVTQPDKPSGRGMQLNSPPVKTLALANNIPVMQPTNLKDPVFASELSSFNADIFVVVAFSILPKEVLACSKFGAINIHGSLLPKYRGAAPVQWAIANCEKETGITIFLLDEKMDHGPILEQRVLPIAINDTTETMLAKMVAPACDALDKALAKIESGGFTPIEQNHAESSPAPKLKKEDGLIDWNMSAMQIHKRLCAFTPFPGMYAFLNGQKLFIRKTAILSAAEITGERNNGNYISAGNIKEAVVAGGCPKQIEKGEFFVDKNNVFAGTGDGVLQILEVQGEGKKRMPAADFFRGAAKGIAK